jgi:RecB family endonuclease NucS
MADCRGVLAAQVVKPQARVLAEAREIAWVEVASRSSAASASRT